MGRVLSVMLALAVLGASTPVDGQPATASIAAQDPLAGKTIVAIWNEAALEAIRESSAPAPIASRMLAMVNTAMYDAWAAYDPVALGTDGTARLKRRVHDRSGVAVERAMAIAAFYTLRDVSAIPMADVTLAQTHQVLGRNDEAESLGHAVAQAVCMGRHADGSNQLGDQHRGSYSDYTGYRTPNRATFVSDPSHWQPLLVYDENGSFHTQHFLTPQWANVRPFAIATQQLAGSVGHPAQFGDERYRRQAQMLLDMSGQLTDEQKTIAEYWADGMMTDSPPGHWIRFGIWISKRDHHTVAADAKMFFALSNALMDAGILCWYVKRRDDSERPITAIHKLFAGQRVWAWAGPQKGAQWIDGAAWQPYQAPDIVTPPFPEFFSGHSTFSAAGAEVLRRFTGSDRFGASYTQPVGTSIVEPGLPTHPTTLSWATFSEAADQAGLSRRYGGIHFEDADLAGRHAGRDVGAIAYARAQEFILGHAADQSAMLGEETHR